MKHYSTEENIDMARRELLESLWLSGVNSVSGSECVKRFFDSDPLTSEYYNVIAIGKAANDMMLGALTVFGDRLRSGLVLTKDHHLTDLVKQNDHIVCHESSHPVPSDKSLQAGELLLKYIAQIETHDKVIVLISGGASSLVEVLVDTCSLEHLKAINEWALQNGLNINEINYMRQKVSLIKGGKLCAYFPETSVQCLYISDVPNDNMDVIGSGLLHRQQELSLIISNDMQQRIDDFISETIGLNQTQGLVGNTVNTKAQFEHHIIANNTIAKQATRECAKSLGLSASIMDDSIDMDYREVADMIAQKVLKSQPGVYIWGGEPTVELPSSPGQGGRNQALALLLGLKLSGYEHISVLVAGTDGTDGPTDAAGAIIDGQSVNKASHLGWDVNRVLSDANAYPCLGAIDSLFLPGPTGTNVMDLVVVLVE